MLIEDLQVLEPTVFCAVPRLLTRIHDKILSQLGVSSLKSRLLGLALKVKLDNLEASRRNKGELSLGHRIFDSMVFYPIKRALGLHRVHTLVSGGAPLPVSTMDFFRVLLGPSAQV